MSEVTLVLGSDFLASFAALPKKIQTKVTKFIRGFKQQPTSGAYHYETLHTRDTHLRSVRIDQEYRGIIYKPDTENMYILVWVDNHDKAYTWAHQKVFEVHPDTGALQMIDFSDIPKPQEKELEQQQSDDLFAEYRDRELIKLGIPEVLVPYIRTLKTEKELENAEGKIPQEAWEALFLLNAGESLQDVYNEVLSRQEEQELRDLRSSLIHVDTKRRFVVVTDDDELKDMLSYPLDAWRVFLHPMQRKTVQMNAKGPVRVLGGAGTGKTVVAMHRAKWLAEQIFTQPTDIILFTTFTKNLASDIRENLKRICTLEQLKRIEVVHIDGWVADFLRRRSYQYTYVSPNERKDSFDEAVMVYEGHAQLPMQFFLDEWDLVVQQQGISTLKGYLKSNRVGRGRSLRVDQRKAIWPVFEEYRSMLDERMKFEFTDAARSVMRILDESLDLLPYRSVVVDEAQDLDEVTFRLIRSISKNRKDNEQNELFITGDAHQRIYGRKIVLSQCGIEIRGRSRRLRVNYRTPEEIRSWALSILGDSSFDDLNGGTDSLKGYHSLLHGANPEMCQFDSFGEEITGIQEHIQSLLESGEDPESICLILRTNELVQRYCGALETYDLPVYEIKTHDERTDPGVRIATMHRVKGLEFNHVVCAGINEGIIPYQSVMDRLDNEETKKAFELQERSLLFVAVTRARKSVMITSFGNVSPIILNQ